MVELLLASGRQPTPEEAFDQGYDVGYLDGKSIGHEDGYEAGYEDGLNDGSTDAASEAADEAYERGWHDAVVEIFRHLKENWDEDVALTMAREYGEGKVW